MMRVDFLGMLSQPGNVLLESLVLYLRCGKFIRIGDFLYNDGTFWIFH